MNQLTVYFKNKIVNSISLEKDKAIHIGSDDTNDLVIDSSDIAPAHAAVILRATDCAIKQLNEHFPLVVNGKPTRITVLQDGDTIAAGQHSIVYSTDHQPIKSKLAQLNHIPHVANYQVIGGTNLGKMFHLKTPMTLLGEQGSGVVVISKRKDGYFASVLENAEHITLNKQPLTDKAVKLNHDDVLVIGHLTVQFCLQ